MSHSYSLHASLKSSPSLLPDVRSRDQIRVKKTLLPHRMSRDERRATDIRVVHWHEGKSGEEWGWNGV